MELFLTVLVAFVIVLLVGGLFSATGARGPWPSMLWFFVILFLGTLAVGVWADPIGPRAWGVPWLGLLVTAIFIGLLIAAATPDYRHGRRDLKELPLQRDTSEPSATQPAPRNPHEAESEEIGTATAMGVFFWVFIILAVTVVVIRFLTQPAL